MWHKSVRRKMNTTWHLLFFCKFYSETISFFDHFQTTHSDLLYVWKVLETSSFRLLQMFVARESFSEFTVGYFHVTFVGRPKLEVCCSFFPVTAVLYIFTDPLDFSVLFHPETVYFNYLWEINTSLCWLLALCDKYKSPHLCRF